LRTQHILLQKARPDRGSEVDGRARGRGTGDDVNGSSLGVGEHAVTRPVLHCV
jgi:hypothetical protein